MRYCKRCVNPDTIPKMKLDEDGLCPVCKFREEVNRGEVDWAARRRELDEIAQWGRDNSKCSYDCIIGVSGGKDSTRQAFYARDELGLKPLLVSSTYPPEQLTERGAHNWSNLIENGFDTVTVALDPKTWKRSVQQGFFKYANWCKATELPLYAIPIHFAIAYKIPLVFLGENPTYVIGECHAGTGGDANQMKHSNTLGGGRPDHLVSDDTSLRDLYFYTYPSDDDMEYGKVRVVYMGYYIEDFNGYTNAKFAIEHGLQVRHHPPEEIGDITGYQSLDEDFVIPNQMIKRIKLGYGQVTDKVCQAIQLGTMTREEGIELVRRYDGACHPRYIERFAKYLGLSVEEWWEVVERFRNHDIWERDENGEWRLKGKFDETE